MNALGQAAQTFLMRQRLMAVEGRCYLLWDALRLRKGLAKCT